MGGTRQAPGHLTGDAGCDGRRGPSASSETASWSRSELVPSRTSGPATHQGLGAPGDTRV